MKPFIPSALSDFTMSSVSVGMPSYTNARSLRSSPILHFPSTTCSRQAASLLHGPSTTVTALPTRSPGSPSSAPPRFTL
ncbi:MAG: hypothetical protein IT374_20005 [Polyangiaceae bacterium]|nr:hypothetical protein [Polyangiaceae bacterium]